MDNLLPQSLINQTFPKNNQKGGESVHLITNGKKYNRFGVPQDRVIVLSDLAFYLCSKTRVHTQMWIKDLVYLVKSTKSNEFLLVFKVKDENVDLRVSSDEREDILDFTKLRFAFLAPTRGLKVFGVPESSLKNFKSTRKS